MDGDPDAHLTGEPDGPYGAADTEPVGHYDVADTERRLLAQLAWRRELAARVVGRLSAPLTGARGAAGPPGPAGVRALARLGQRPIGIGQRLGLPHLLHLPNRQRRELDWGELDRFWSERLRPDLPMLRRRRGGAGGIGNGATRLPPARDAAAWDTHADLNPASVETTTSERPTGAPNTGLPASPESTPATPNAGVAGADSRTATPSTGVGGAESMTASPNAGLRASPETTVAPPGGVWRRLAAVLRPFRALAARETARTAEPTPAAPALPANDQTAVSPHAASPDVAEPAWVPVKLDLRPAAARTPAEQIAPLVGKLTGRLLEPLGMIFSAARTARPSPSRLFWWPATPPSAASSNAHHGIAHATARPANIHDTLPAGSPAPGLLGAALEVRRAAVGPAARVVHFVDQVQHARHFATSTAADTGRWRVRSTLTTQSGAAEDTEVQEESAAETGQDETNVPLARFEPPSGVADANSAAPIRLQLGGGLLSRIRGLTRTTAPREQARDRLGSARPVLHALTPPALRRETAVAASTETGSRLVGARPVSPASPGEPVPQRARPLSAEPIPHDEAPVSPPTEYSERRRLDRPGAPRFDDFEQPFEQPGAARFEHTEQRREQPGVARYDYSETGRNDVPGPPHHQDSEPLRSEANAPPPLEHSEQQRLDTPAPRFDASEHPDLAEVRPPHLADPEQGRSVDRRPDGLLARLRRRMAVTEPRSLVPIDLGDAPARVQPPPPAGPTAPARRTPGPAHILPQRPTEVSDAELARVIRGLPAPMAAAALAAGVLGETAGQAALARSGLAHQTLAPTTATPPAPDTTSDAAESSVLASAHAGSRRVNSKIWNDATSAHADTARLIRARADTSAGPRSSAQTESTARSGVHVAAQPAPWSAPLHTHHAPASTVASSSSTTATAAAASSFAAAGFAAAPLARDVEPPPVQPTSTGTSGGHAPGGVDQHSGGAAPAADPNNLDRLAEEVLDKLRWRLAVERERLMG